VCASSLLVCTAAATSVGLFPVFVSCAFSVIFIVAACTLMFRVIQMLSRRLEHHCASRCNSHFGGDDDSNVWICVAAVSAGAARKDIE